MSSEDLATLCGTLEIFRRLAHALLGRNMLSCQFPLQVGPYRRNLGGKEHGVQPSREIVIARNHFDVVSGSGIRRSNSTRAA